MKIRTGLLIAAVGALVVATVYADGTTNQAAARTPATNGQSATVRIGWGKRLPKELAEKLTGDQIVELLKTEKAESNPGPWIVAICALGSVTFMALHMFFHNRSRAMLHRTLAMMIEKGTPIPPELLQSTEPIRSDLRRGLVACGIGIGLMFFFGTLRGTSDKGLWAVGLIPLFVGIARLISWKLEQRKPNS
ncbi:MAG: DUF6249 domain-containing protein [Verrucomicrobiia bacterium]